MTTQRNRTHNKFIADKTIFNINSISKQQRIKGKMAWENMKKKWNWDLSEKINVFIKVVGCIVLVIGLFIVVFSLPQSSMATLEIGGNIIKLTDISENNAMRLSVGVILIISGLVLIFIVDIVKAFTKKKRLFKHAPNLKPKL
ncbi:MAG: hypothetical protein NTX24_02710 [Candidatus Pacearchaeota archaeon]|nr:hypothetical protein [Candidatus Pacearchaeota archaeon]